MIISNLWDSSCTRRAGAYKVVDEERSDHSVEIKTEEQCEWLLVIVE